MKKYHLSHALQYAVLAVVFLVSIPTLFVVRQEGTRIFLIFALSLFYLVVGIWHHLEEKNLTATTLLEYLAVSLIIFVVLFSVFR